MAIEIIIVIFLIVLGIALLMAEIFFLPGITIAGFAGSLSLLGGVVYAFVYIGNTAGFVTIGGSAVLGLGSFIYLIKSNTMSRIALNTDINATVDQSELKQLKIGDTGYTLSRLNPIGKAQFGDVMVEAKSLNGEYIDEDIAVRIVKIESYNVLVELLD